MTLKKNFFKPSIKEYTNRMCFQLPLEIWDKKVSWAKWNLLFWHKIRLPQLIFINTNLNRIVMCLLSKKKKNIFDITEMGVFKYQWHKYNFVIGFTLQVKFKTIFRTHMNQHS